MKKVLLPLIALLAAGTFGAAQSKAVAPKTPRLYVFDCGTLYATDTSNYQLKKEEVATPTMSMLCFLIAHPKGNLIWDTGAIPDSSFKGGEGAMRNSKSTKTLTAQMAEVGYRPADIKYLALSHFHWDHVGNANLFAGATWLTPKAERDVMFGDPPSPRTEPASFSALKTSKTVFLSKDEYDVFGDKTVIIKAAPGHSPGHQVLYLKLAKTGPVVLSGDLYHYPEERSLNRVPTTEFNAQQTVASRASVEAYIKKTGAPIWIQHDYTGSAKLKKSPQFYE